MGPKSFRPFVKEVNCVFSMCFATLNTLISRQQPVIVPGDAHDVVALKGRIGVYADRGIHIFDLEEYGFPALSI